MAALQKIMAHSERVKVRAELTPTLNRLEDAARRGTVTPLLVWECLDAIDKVIPGPLGSESVRATVAGRWSRGWYVLRHQESGEAEVWDTGPFGPWTLLAGPFRSKPEAEGGLQAHNDLEQWRREARR